MDPQNLGYALVQVAHNFGAVIVTGGAATAYWRLRAGATAPAPFAWLVLAGWAVQAISGAGFAAISYAYYERLPDLHGIAAAALAIKMGCAAAGFATAALWLKYAPAWPARRGRVVWGFLAALAALALVSAAFLRWFS